MFWVKSLTDLFHFPPNVASKQKSPKSPLKHKKTKKNLKTASSRPQKNNNLIILIKQKLFLETR